MGFLGPSEEEIRQARLTKQREIAQQQNKLETLAKETPQYLDIRTKVTLKELNVIKDAAVKARRPLHNFVLDSTLRCAEEILGTAEKKG